MPKACMIVVEKPTFLMYSFFLGGGGGWNQKGYPLYYPVELPLNYLVRIMNDGKMERLLLMCLFPRKYNVLKSGSLHPKILTSTQ